MKTQPRGTALALISVLLMSTLACRPVITVGYSEVLIVLVIGVILLGPLLLRIYRFIERARGAPPPEERPKRKRRRKEPRD